MTTAEFLSRLEHVTKTADGWQAGCPAHKDRKPSLTVKEGDDGRTLLHCHAGCPVESICAALGIKQSDLFIDKPKGAAKRIVAEYDYKEAEGNHLFQVVRYEPKDFRQRRKGQNGEWIWNMEGVKRVPFHLPELLAAVRAGLPIFICEGEKDVLTVEKAGFAATCNPGGAGKWQAHYNPFFKGAEVVILADKDPPGRKHANDVAGQLASVARTVKNIECPDVDGKVVKDVADYFAAGRQGADLDEMAQAAPIWEAAKTPKEETPWMALVEDGADITAKELKPPVEIVQGVICEMSKLVICSGAKAFKTWLTIMMALCVSHGVPFLERQTNRRRVLYCNLELKPATFDRRLQAIAKALNITVDKLWFYHLPLRGHMAGLSLPEIVSRLIALARHFEAGVIVIDPVFKLNIEGEENSSRDQTVFFLQLDRLTTEAGCTAILNDHSGKGNQSEKDPLDVIRGSSAKGGDLDAAMVLRKHEIEGCFRVDLVHRELPPVEPFVLQWKYPLMILRAELDPDAMKKAKGGQTRKHDPLKLLAAIKDTNPKNATSISAWAGRAGISRQTLQNYLPQIRSKDWISTTGEGNTARQFITDSGQEAVAKWESEV